MILRNQFYSERRRSWRSCSLDAETAERTLVAVTNPDAGLELDELRRAMAMLPDDQREALILIGAAGVSYEEAAEITGVAIGTIKSLFNQPGSRSAYDDPCIGVILEPPGSPARRWPTSSAGSRNIDLCCA